MGLLTEGSPLSWDETQKYADHVRKHGVDQFIRLYDKLKGRAHDALKWGDEIEYMLFKLDHEKKTAKLLLRADELLPELMLKEKEGHSDLASMWRPEFSNYMIEGTPGVPYGHRLAHLNLVEDNMRQRQQEALKLLGENETVISLSTFPRIGSTSFTHPAINNDPKKNENKSLFFPDDAIYPAHPRFKTLSRNIPKRRGEKVAINIPIFQDKNTPKPFIEDFTVYGDDGSSKKAAKQDHIYMDAMGFGMGLCCLQMTFQACNIKEARYLYDQLTPLSPIMMALSAGSPIFRGFLADVDCRWNTISAAVDCRTEEERGQKPLKNNKRTIRKSRYDSIDSYLSCEGHKYNDVDLEVDEAILKTLQDAGIDALLAQHIAHLFIRDPISLFSEKINPSSMDDTDHFENLQSTNWQTMRFKPPPPDSPIGWRVEFRSMEVQLTPFENAAYAVFIVLLTRVILSFNLNLLIPISKVDENVQVSQKRDAVKNELFYFRKDLLTEFTSCSKMKKCFETPNKINEDEYTKMSINTIINGKEGEFPGLIPLIKSYLEGLDDGDVDTTCTILQYLDLIKQRASGEKMTSAKWMRDFVINHEKYQQDSVVSEEINYDLICSMDRISKGEPCPKLLTKYNTKTKDDIPKAMKKAENILNGNSRNSP